MANRPEDVGKEAVQKKGWLKAHKWLILRRLSQLGILAAFAAGPWLGLWIVKGNLSYSLTLDTLPLTDPYVLLQALVGGVVPETIALVGVALVILFYSLVGGRVYCSWVCPVNMITDTAAWLRRKLGIRGTTHASRSTRFWILGLTFVLSAITGSIVWELVNPVTITVRALLFGVGLAWILILAIFLFDLFVARDGWCGHYCPVGAFYSLMSSWAPLRVVAANREACDDCMDCFNVCPEPQVIKPALKGASKGIGPVITANQCTNCGRCIDVCAVDVFHYGNRYSKDAGTGKRAAGQVQATHS